MRINAIIAATMIAVTSVSAAALPVAEDTVAIPQDTDVTDHPEFPQELAEYFPEGFDPETFDPEHFEAFLAKRDAEAANSNPPHYGFGGWTFTPWRPYGSPVSKRDAAAANSNPPTYSFGGWTFTPWRPYGSPVSKRDAAAANSNPPTYSFGGWTFTPWRPYGSPVSKRNAETEAAPEAHDD